MRKLVSKDGVELWEERKALFSSEQAFNAEYVVFCSKYSEITALKEMGVENIVCIKSEPERLANFVRFREGRMNQVMIYVKSTRARDLLAEVCKKPYYTINYVGNSEDLKGQGSVKDAIDSRIENIKKDIENKRLREQLRKLEDDDEELEEFMDST